MDNGELLARKQGALQACDEANQSYQTALRDYRKARRVKDEAMEAYQEARQAYYMAWRDYEEAGRKEEI